jgi:uncharacterized protein
VYVEEVPSGAVPIAGVSTSIAAFIGQVADNIEMPFRPGRPLDPDNIVPADRYTVAVAGVPQLITSWEQFKNTFGDFRAGNQTLAHAVYGYFNNGGSRCWVVRVTDATDVNSVTSALNSLRPIDEITMVAVPGALDVNLQTAILDHCENAGDRFAIIDGQRATSLTPADIQGTLRDSNYAALYFPWINVFYPVTSANIFVPPSGHLAGIYARVDNLRGVHKAPANEVIRGAVEVETRLSKADQDGLNPDGINIIRQFNGNVTVWGARTLGGDANVDATGDWKYINVRRLFLFLRESIDEGTQWVVFEPNTPDLWAQITRNVTAFLTNV